MNRILVIIVSIVVVVAVAGGSFYGGMVYGQSQARAQRQFGAAQRQGGQGGQGGMIFGQITAIGEGTLTVTDNNGKETQVKVTDTTLIEKNMTVPLTQLTQGETVIVSGSQGTDGSITARSVRSAPAGRFGAGGPQAGDRQQQGGGQ